MLPFHIYTEQRGPRLYQLDDGRFQIIEKGDLGPFMSGYGYVLADRDLADFLEQLDAERVTFKDAVVWDRTSNAEYTTYRQILINQHFSHDQIRDLNIEGTRMLMMGNEYPFVSPMLKHRLENSQFTYLRFSEGLSGFAGQI
ncbi:hypothetical protein D3870_17135 [Noviherbaspirillum cavernae]|uniref:Uncharacterized protein n=1 Tax=Noviherbaspirillum cavernae TaxID=2320862 RepID=A0A418X4S8_9BURK|nr:hypothetical protein D3870_17135 [Noviherbaspirillum cavernae]